MQKIKLEAVFVNDTNPQGEPLKNKNGEPYKMAVIQWEGKKASCYLGAKFGVNKEKEIRTWTQGQEVTVTLEQKGDYLNFDIPSRLDYIEERVARLEERNSPAQLGGAPKVAVAVPYAEVPNNSGISQEKIDSVKPTAESSEDLPF